MLISEFKNSAIVWLLFASLTFVLPVLNAWATSENLANTVLEVQKIYSDEKKGIEYFKKGQYASAFLTLDKTAKLGLKRSQYYLGFMYLKGHYVEVSIETGMAWLGVAAESEVVEWVALYEKIFAELGETQQGLIQSKLVDYIGKYGMRAQKITCEKRASLGSRKRRLYCEKYVHSIEMSETYR